jgi:hypothetical protein
MAVDYFHRLVVIGPGKGVRAFGRQMHREYPRTVGRKTWTEIVPFSFSALYALAPNASRVEPEIPFDPYDLSAWPVRRIDSVRAEIRYQFQTRNLELAPLLGVLSRAVPSLTFTLVTLCLDDSSVSQYRLRAGRTSQWPLPERRQNLYWNMARKTFRLNGDDIYEDYGARAWVEERMLDEALFPRDRSGSTTHAPERRRYRWFNRPVLRDLETEQEFALYEMADALASQAASKTRRRTSAARSRKRQRRPKR